MTVYSEKLTGVLSDQLPKVCYGIGVIGAIICLVTYFGGDYKEQTYFLYSYLTAFTFFISLSFGGMFFVLMQFLVSAGWGVAVRRIPEVVMKNINIFPILFFPIFIGAVSNQLYHWNLDGAWEFLNFASEQGNDHYYDKYKTDPIVQGKTPYLNVTFFLIRAIIFFAAWSFLSNKFFKKSVEQDSTGDKKLTISLQNASTYGVLIFGITISFAAIDWIMSLTPHWYSTIFGVYLFAGSAVGSLSFFSIIYLILRKYGYLKDKVTVEHYHDLGKLIYGFNVFWAYIAFSQYFLIWYANLPEETEYFIHHFYGSWNGVGLFLSIGHFLIPFILFMSRHAKRNLKFHFIMAIWILFTHLVDIYWLIMPTIHKKGLSISITDFVCFLTIGGFFLGAFFNQLSKQSLLPNKDPRIDESLKLDNY